jgi:hypothetical protein
MKSWLVSRSNVRRGRRGLGSTRRYLCPVVVLVS